MPNVAAAMRASAASIMRISLCPADPRLSSASSPSRSVTRSSTSGSQGCSSSASAEARRAPCTLRFHVATEGGWDIGGASGLFCAALALHLGLPLWTGILMSFFGVAAMVVLLQRYYAPRPGLTYPSP